MCRLILIHSWLHIRYMHTEYTESWLIMRLIFDCMISQSYHLWIVKQYISCIEFTKYNSKNPPRKNHSKTITEITPPNIEMSPLTYCTTCYCEQTRGYPLVYPWIDRTEFIQHYEYLHTIYLIICKLNVFIEDTYENIWTFYKIAKWKSRNHELLNIKSLYYTYIWVYKSIFMWYSCNEQMIVQVSVCVCVYLV